MLKIAYLTIDDFPSTHARAKVDYLFRKGIPAVLFCQGSNLAARPNDGIYALQRGFTLGNHAYDHPFFSGLSLEGCFVQIQRTDALIERLYAEAGVERGTKRYFRFPYGDKGGLLYNEVFAPYEGEGAQRKQAIQDYLCSLGYNQPIFPGITYRYFREAGLLADVDWNWTYDVMEWSLTVEEPQFGIDSIEKVYARMDEDVPEGCRGLNYPGSEEILLTHDHADTGQYFEGIMERLLLKGIVFREP